MIKNRCELAIGHAQADITPPLTVSMAGYAFRQDNGCTSIDDPLVADACFLQYKQVKMLWITLDLAMIDEAWSVPLRESIASALDLPFDNIVICASHTHFGPATGKPVNDAHRAWLQQMVEELLRIAIQAASNTQPATARTGCADISAVAFNRRPVRSDGTCCTTYTLPAEEEGLRFRPIDPHQTVIRFDNPAGQPVLLFVSTPMHAVVGGKDTYAISPDYPGALRTALQRVYGVPVMFAAGTAGNVVPFRRGEGMRPLIGNYLAGAAMQAAEQSVSCGDWLGVKCQSFAVPIAKRLTVEAMAEKEQAARTHLEQSKQTSNAWKIARAQHAWERASALLKATQRLGPGETKPFDITVISLGELGIVAFPGEIFAETGLYIKSRSPFPSTLVISLCNHHTGYLATRSAIWEGGYEGVATIYCSESEGFVAEQAVDLLYQVWEECAPGRPSSCSVSATNNT